MALRELAGPRVPSRSEPGDRLRLQAAVRAGAVRCGAPATRQPLARIARRLRRRPSPRTRSSWVAPGQHSAFTNRARRSITTCLSWRWAHAASGRGRTRSPSRAAKTASRSTASSRTSRTATPTRRLRGAAGTTWPLPLYELALMARRACARDGSDPGADVRNAGGMPASGFGPEASADVVGLLEGRGDRHVAPPRTPSHEARGVACVRPATCSTADRIVTVPPSRHRTARCSRRLDGLHPGRHARPGDRDHGRLRRRRRDAVRDQAGRDRHPAGGRGRRGDRQARRRTARAACLPPGDAGVLLHRTEKHSCAARSAAAATASPRPATRRSGGRPPRSPAATCLPYLAGISRRTPASAGSMEGSSRELSEPAAGQPRGTADYARRCARS